MDDEVTPHLKCDIELEFTGPNSATLNIWAAQALRKLADRIENDEFDSGWHEVTDNVGKPLGNIYVDYSGDV